MMSPREFGKVAVLMGGRSAEREISRLSGNAVLAALKGRGVDAHAFDPAQQPLAGLASGGFQRAFIILHGRHGEDGTVQGALEWMGIPYTGSGVLASALALDKWRTKLVWLAIGINTPRFEVLGADSDFAAIASELGLPLIVKPSREGSTLGLTKVTAIEQIGAAYELAARHDSTVLAEQFIAGAELTAAILDEQALPLIRIEAPGGMYDYHAKYFSDDTRYRCPCGLPPEQEAALKQAALRAYRILGCEGWGRVDLMLDAYGEAWFLEVNTAPGMTGHSLVPMAAQAAGIAFDELVMMILEAAHVG